MMYNVLNIGVVFITLTIFKDSICKPTDVKTYRERRNVQGNFNVLLNLYKMNPKLNSNVYKRYAKNFVKVPFKDAKIYSTETDSYELNNTYKPNLNKQIDNEHALYLSKYTQKEEKYQEKKDSLESKFKPVFDENDDVSIYDSDESQRKNGINFLSKLDVLGDLLDSKERTRLQNLRYHKMKLKQSKNHNHINKYKRLRENHRFVENEDNRLNAISDNSEENNMIMR